MGGFEMPLATFKIAKFADTLKQSLTRVCPKCGKVPSEHVEYYQCNCCPQCGVPLTKVGADWTCAVHGKQEPPRYKTWQSLKAVLPDGTPLLKTRLQPEDEKVKAEAYVMDVDVFVKYCDATVAEYGIYSDDVSSAKNLRKLLVAMRKLGKVVLIHFNDTYEERVGIITTSISNRIIIKEIMPLNLADIGDTMKVDLNEISEQDILEAQTLIKQLPVATEEQLKVHDYRTQGIEQAKTSPKVLELSEIIKMASKNQTT